MATIFVSGITVLEVSLPVAEFPVAYAPTISPGAGIEVGVAGVAFNVAAGLAALGNQVRLHTFLGCDATGATLSELVRRHHPDIDVTTTPTRETPRSVILHDERGRRAVANDHRGLHRGTFDVGKLVAGLDSCDLAVIANIDANRILLHEAERHHVPVSVDLQAIRTLDGEYDAEFIKAATIVMFSSELLALAPSDAAGRLLSQSAADLVVGGCGRDGAVGVSRSDRRVRRAAATAPDGVASTVGAGDALHAAVVDGWLRHLATAHVLRRATLFAGAKVAVVGGAQGLTEAATTVRMDDKARRSPNTGL